jgi:hypothetical protein
MLLQRWLAHSATSSIEAPAKRRYGFRFDCLSLSFERYRSTAIAAIRRLTLTAGRIRRGLAPELTSLKVRTTPTVTEIKYTEEHCRLYPAR